MDSSNSTLFQDALTKDLGIPADVALCIEQFCCDLENIQCSDIGEPSSAERQLTWPSLIIENDNLFIQATPDLFDDTVSFIKPQSFACVAKWRASPDSQQNAEWHIIGNIRSEQLVIGIGGHSLNLPEEVRITDQYFNEKVFAIDSKKRAEFKQYAPTKVQIDDAYPRKVRNLPIWNESAKRLLATVKAQMLVPMPHQDLCRSLANTAMMRDDYCRTVLCDFVDSDAICNGLGRFRIRFRVKADAIFGFGVGFAYADGIHLETGLNLATNHKRSVGVLVRSWDFYPMHPSNVPIMQCMAKPAVLSGVNLHDPNDEWLLEFDFIAKSFSLHLRLRRQWALCFKSVLSCRVITPAFTLYDPNGEIEIV